MDPLIVSAANIDCEEQEPARNLEGLESENASLEDFVFTNRLVLETVFMNCVAYDLKKFRLVNKLWNEASVTVLVRRRLVKLSISDYSLKLQGKFTFPSSELVKVNFHFSDPSRRLPFTCLDLDMSCWTEDNSPTLIHTFELFGTAITTLMLSECTEGDFKNVPVKKLRDLLIKYFRNVTELFLFPLSLAISSTANESADEEDDVQLFYESTILPALKKISFGSRFSHSSIIKELIAASPYLEHIQNIDVDWVNIFEETGRIDLVKDYYHKYEYGYVNMTFRFAELYPELRILNVPYFYQFVCSDVDDALYGLQEFLAFRKILRSSKDSLESLTCFPYSLLSLNKDEEALPAFRNLKELSIFHPIASWSKFGQPPYFPRQMNVLEVFPAVEKLVLAQSSINLKSMMVYFPQDDFEEGVVQYWGSVTTLEIKSSCRNTDRSGLIALGKKFPNVKHLKVHSVYSLFRYESLELFLPWQELESIELRGLSLDFVYDFQLDSFLTGISCETLRDLQHRENKQDANIVELEDLKSCTGIFDFQCLTQLKIVFDNESNANWVLRDNLTEMLTTVSSYTWDYGFKLLPNLRSVVFAFDQDLYCTKNLKLLLAPSPLPPFIRFENAQLNLMDTDWNEDRHNCFMFHFNLDEPVSIDPVLLNGIMNFKSESRSDSE